MEKTALTQLIDYMENVRINDKVRPIDMARQLLEVEREQIEEAYEKGRQEATSQAIREIHKNYTPNK